MQFQGFKRVDMTYQCYLFPDIRRQECGKYRSMSHHCRKSTAVDEKIWTALRLRISVVVTFKRVRPSCLVRRKVLKGQTNLSSFEFYHLVTVSRRFGSRKATYNVISAHKFANFISEEEVERERKKVTISVCLCPSPSLSPPLRPLFQRQ